MPSRRQFFFVLGSGLALGPVVAWLAGPGNTSHAVANTKFPVEKTDAEWKRELTPQQYAVLRRHSTERPFTSALDREKRRGTFVCAACAQALFSSETKFNSGTGWP